MYEMWREYGDVEWWRETYGPSGAGYKPASLDSPWIFINRLFSVDVTKCSVLVERASRRSEPAAHIKGTCIPAAYFSLPLSIYLSHYTFLPLVTHSYTTPAPTWKSNSILHEMSLETPLASRRAAEHGSARFINSVSVKCDWKIREARVPDLRGARLENFQSAIRHFARKMHFLRLHTKRCGRGDVGFFARIRLGTPCLSPN